MYGYWDSACYWLVRVPDLRHLLMVQRLHFGLRIRNKEVPIHGLTGTSIGLVLSGIGAIFLASEWRFTYLVYALIGIIAFMWNAKVLPRTESNRHVTFKKGKLSIKGVNGA